MRDYDLLSIDLTHLDGVAVLVLRGEIDAFTAPGLTQSVEAVSELGGPIALDMALVTFMDSSGIRALINACATADELRRSVQIRRPSDQVRRVLSLTGLDDMLPPES